MGNSTLLERRDSVLTEMKSIIEAAVAREFTEDELGKIDQLEASAKSINASLAAAQRAKSVIDSFGITETSEFTKTNDANNSLGEHFVKHVDADSLKTALQVKGGAIGAPEFKAATDTHTVPTSPAHLILPDVDRNIVRPFTERLWLTDWLTAGSISSNAITYFVEAITGALEGDFTVVGENAKKPQMHFGGWNQVTETLRKIAGYIKISKEMLEDADFLVTEINTRLLRQLAIREEQLLLTGDGTGLNPVGLLNRSGVQTHTYATGATPTVILDAIYEGLTKVENTTGFRPDAVVIHPTDYQKLRLAKDANGQYLAGGPFQGQYGQGNVMIEPPIWGTNVIKTSAITQGTILVGSGDASTVYRKGGIEVSAANQNEDDFVNNRVTVLAEERISLATRVPAAYCKISAGAGGGD